MPPVGTENQPMQYGAMAKTSSGPASAPSAARPLLHILLRQLLLGIEIVAERAWRRGRDGAAVAQPAVVIAVREVDHHPDTQPDAEAPPRFFGQVLRQENAGESAQHRQEP